MSAFFNQGSLFLGVIAWMIPLFFIKRRSDEHRTGRFTIYSFTFCACAMIFQFLELRHRVNINDLSAVMDTIHAICIASIILVVVTIAINLFVAHLHSTQNK